MGCSGDEASLDALRALQRERLRAVVALAYDRVPHYREKFGKAGLHPDDLKGPDDLARFPFTTKEDLRATYPFGMFAVPMKEIVRIHASSGTTGKPTVVGYTRRDIATWSALMARSIRAAGGRPGDKIHNAYAYGLFTGGFGFHYGAEQLGATVIPAGGGFTARQVQLIADFKPDIILATPSYMLTIADEFERQGLDPRGSGLRIGMFGAEPWSEGMREEIERRTGLAAMNHYGLSEVMGPGVAQERIGVREGMTVWEDHFYPEIIDPESGRVLADGEEGELVLTTLTKQGMPLIRYRTRDLTRLLPPAGRGRRRGRVRGPAHFRRIDRVRGRTDDMLIVRGVNVFPSQIEAVLAKEARVAPHYRLELRRPGRLDELDVVVEARGAGTEAERAGIAPGIAESVEHLIKMYVGVTTRVRVVPPGTIERSEGKARRVVDLRTVDPGAKA